MGDVLARKAPASDGRAIDLATGRTATLVTGSAGGISDQARWSVRCDVLQRLHHRGVATLVDFGIVGECSRFEAWSCGPEWTGLRDRGRVVAEHACTFCGANGLSCSAASQIRVSAGRAVALPDASSGYPAPVTSSDSSTVDAYGLTAIVRPAVATLAEMFRVAHTPRPQIASLRGPRGS